MSKELRKGYTTGVHASFAFRSALEAFLATNSFVKSITNKMDNDDLDVTKGCEIVVTISNRVEDLELNPLKHTPYEISTLKLYAGVGVGVVTKDGLKAPKGFPAINPTPLKAIEQIYHKFRAKKEIFSAISVTNGEELAKQTANAKVGVLGGISILGTTGFVKPVSSVAYIDSIRTEIAFAKANGYDKIVLTLGNSSFNYAKKQYKEEQIVEIGNFVYDAIAIAQTLGIDKVVFICGIGKATKVMQGCKNTHNRFGSIDFVDLKDKIVQKLGIEVDIESTKTVKGVTAQLKNGVDEFYRLVTIETNQQIEDWFRKIEIETVILR